MPCTGIKYTNMSDKEKERKRECARMRVCVCHVVCVYGCVRVCLYVCGRDEAPVFCYKISSNSNQNLCHGWAMMLTRCCRATVANDLSTIGEVPKHPAGPGQTLIPGGAV